MSGSLPEELRRWDDCSTCDGYGEFVWPPPVTGDMNYNWEALQGAVMQAVIVQRKGDQGFSGLNSAYHQDQALKRAADWIQYYPDDGQSPPHDGYLGSDDDVWVRPVLNQFLGTYYPTDYSTIGMQPGKNFGFTDYLALGSW